MTKKTRNTLKGFFETGKKPTEGQYANLIDSHLILDGENTGSLNLKGNVVVRGEITASGNISSSGNIIADQFIGDGRLITGLTSSLITVSTVTASVATGSLIISGTLYHPSASTNILVGLKTTGSIIPGRDGLFDVGSPTHYFKDSFVSKSHSNIVTTTNLIATEGIFTKITSSGNISASGTIRGANYFADTSYAIGTTEVLKYEGGNILLPGSTAIEGHLDIQGGHHITVTGNISSSGAIHTLSHITASGNISASGTITALNFTGSLLGTATTASYVNTAQTASYVTTAQTASYVTTAQTSSYVSADNIDQPFTNITSSGNIKVDGNISASNLLLTNATNPSIILKDSTHPETFKITQANQMATIDISGGSGDIVNNLTLATDYKSNYLQVDGATGTTTIRGHLNMVQGGSQANSPAHITASGNISSSGHISASGGHFKGTVEVSGSRYYTSGSATNQLLGIASTGSILPGVTSDGTTGFDLGSPTAVWRDLWLSPASLKFVSASGEITPLKQEDVKALREGKPIKQATAIGGTDRIVRAQSIFHETSNEHYIKQTVAGIWDFVGPGGNILNIDARDSNHTVNLNSTTSKLNLAGTLSASKTNASHVIGGTTSFGSNKVTINGLVGDITASGNISASGTITANAFVGLGNANYSGNISSSGVLFGSKALINGNITASGNISASGTITSLSGSFSHILGNSPITVQDSITFQSDITSSGNISSSGILHVNEIQNVSTINHDSLDNGNLDFTSAGTVKLRAVNSTSEGLQLFGGVAGAAFPYINTDGFTNFGIKVNNALRIVIYENGIDLIGSVTSSGTISSSGNIIGTNITASNLQITNNSTFGGFMSAQGFGSSNTITSNTSVPANNNAIQLNNNTGNITIADGVDYTVGSGAAVKLPFLLSALDTNAFMSGSLTVKGNISASNITGKKITGVSGSFDNLSVSAFGNITSSGNISASGTISALSGVFNGTVDVSGSRYYTSGSTAQLMSIASTGSIVPGANNVYDLGSPTSVWRDLWLSEDSMRFVSSSGEVTRFRQEDAKRLREGKPVKQATAVGGTDVFLRTQAIFHETSNEHYIKQTVAGLWDYVGPGGNILTIDARDSNHTASLNSTTSLLKIGGELHAGGKISSSAQVYATDYYYRDTNISEIYSPMVGNGNLVSVGALDSGMITSGFTSIDVGSGAITTEGVLTGGNLVTTGNTTLGNASTDTHTITGKTSFIGHITASGNISASGILNASNLSGTNTGDQDLGNYLLSEFTSSFATTGSNINFNNITSSGNISASGTLSATSYIGLPSGIISGAAQLPGSIVSGASQLAVNISGALSTTAIAALGGGYYSSSLQILTTITASGNISASGTITALSMSGDGSGLTGVTAEWDGSHNGNATITGSLTLSGSGYTSLNVLGGITASGNISSSGVITALSMSGDGSGLTGVTAEWDGTHNGNAEITGSLTLSGSGNTGLNVLGNISASGLISSSGTGINYFGGSISASKNISLKGAQSESRHFEFIGTGENNRAIIRQLDVAYTSSITSSGLDYSLDIRNKTLSSTAHLILGTKNQERLRIGATGAITASHHISTSMDLFANNSTFAGGVTAGGNISGSTISASGGIHVFSTITTLGKLVVGSSISGSHISASGNISANGNLEIDGFANIEKSITASSHISSSTGTSNLLNFNSGSFAYLTTTGDISSSTGTVTAVSASFQNLSVSAFGNITSSGNVSASGTVTGLSGSFSNLSVSSFGNITSSGNITASGYISASAFSGDGSGLTGVTAEWDGTHSGNAEITGSLILSGSGPTHLHVLGHISASGNISASNFSGTTSGTNTGDQNLSPYLLSANTASFAVTSSNVLFGHITSSGNISASGNIMGVTGSFDNINVTSFGSITSSGTISATGNISSSGRLYGTTLNTGQGNNELYAMNQNVQTTDHITFYNITASNDLQVKGDTIFGNASNNTHTFTGAITASGAISASGNLSATGDLDIEGKSHFTGHITASGNISASGNITGEVVTGTIVAAVAGFGNYRVISSNQTIPAGFNSVLYVNKRYPSITISSGVSYTVSSTADATILNTNH